MKSANLTVEASISSQKNTTLYRRCEHCSSVKIYKKVLSLFLSLVMLLTIAAGLDFSSFANTSGDYEYTVLSDGTAVITKYNGNGGNITIPSQLNGYIVESTGSAFDGCSSLISVIIPNSVTSIDPFAFRNCNSLTSVTIGNSVTNIGDDAFFGCNSLTSVTIPNSVISIGGNAFSDCSSLTGVTIGSGVISIDDCAFYFCRSLTSITVDSGNKNYSSQDGVLFNKNKTTLIQYPIGNTRTLYTIPRSVESIGDLSFMHCLNLTSVTIPNSVRSIEPDAFCDCESLKSITIPNSVTNIRAGAFDCCKALTSIEIPNNVESIDEYVFSNCESLKSITIPNNVTSIGDCAFYCCISLRDVYYTGTKEQWNKIIIGEYNEDLTNATIHCNEDIKDEKNEFIHNNFKVGNQEYKDKFGYYYSDAYFNGSSTAYNQNLATMSLCLAFSTYGTGSYSTYDKNVKKIMTECGFGENYKQYNFNKEPTNNSIGCAVASKKLDDGTTLIAVAVRSGGYGSEWASNLKLGSASDHDGFDESADKVYGYIASYISNQKISGNVKFWLTGYSRGAAVATQTAAKLNASSGFAYTLNGEYKNASFSKKDIYAYGFATPAGAISSSAPLSADYNNIFSVIEYNDPVPLVAPSNWKFDRYGKTFILPYRESTNSTEYKKYISRIQARLGKNYKIDSFKNYTVGGDKSVANSIYRAVNKDTLGTYNRKLVNGLANTIGSRDSYYKNYQNDLVQFIGKQMGNGKPEFASIMQEACNLAVNMAIRHPNLTATLANNLNLLADVHANPDYYLSWMQLMDSNYPNSLPLKWGSSNYRAVKVNCPVDVNVYDSNGKLVASILNEIPQEVEDSTIISSIDENDQKIIYLPVDEKFDIKVTARENCKVTYGIDEFDTEYGEQTRTVNFSEIDVNKSETIHTNVNSFSNEELENGANDGSDTNYTVYKDSTEIIPDLDIKGADEIVSHSYDIVVDYNKNEGTVYGEGSYIEGSFVKLQAKNNPGYDFEGFYIDGKRIVDDDLDNNRYTVRLEVKSNCRVEAKYNLCNHSNWDSGKITKKATCTANGIKTYTCTVCGETKTETIPKISHTYKTTTTKATTKKNGSVVTKCSVCGAVKSKSTIYYPKTITLSTTSYTYNGKVKTPSVTVKDAKGKKISSKYYTVSYSKGRKNVGQYTVTIKFKGNYSGTVKKTFTIKPKATTLSKVTAGKKAFTVKWKKQATQTTGYQIQYSTSSKFKGAKTVTITKNKTTSKKISKLKSKKKYYVRVRTYKTVKVNGKNTKIYSGWSKVKTVKTK